MKKFFHWTWQLDLQAKISLVLVSVILPIFLVVTIAENKLMLPILQEEIRQIGVNTGKTLAAEIDSSRLLSLANPTPRIENAIQETLYVQPDIVRIDVGAKDPSTGIVKLIASNIEEEPGNPPIALSWVDYVTSEFKKGESNSEYWEINVPIEHKARDSRGPKKIIGIVHVIASTQVIGKMASALWKTTATAAAFSVVSLILILSYFLRKTIENDRLLKQAETHNLQLTEQLHEAERQLMNNEKLAIMGQLTATFAHEIGTPLNAIGGHLQLLQEEVAPFAHEAAAQRFKIVNGQLQKIEQIVKGFLQSTAKPVSQRQLVDLNFILDKTLGILLPRIDSLGIDIKRSLNRQLGPIRVVPLDLEQVLINLINNSLDSLQAKIAAKQKTKSLLIVGTHSVKILGKEWAQITVYDTGEGIGKEDLKNVIKPFFTSKRPGQGTGLGLTICSQIAHKYGGELLIDSRKGAWTKVTLQIPFQGNV